MSKLKSVSGIFVSVDIGLSMFTSKIRLCSCLLIPDSLPQPDP